MMSGEAEKLKQKGNELFIAKEFLEAEKCYTEALASCTDNEVRKVLYTNRSAAKLGLDRFQEAVEDADQAISLDPAFLKAYYRKCSALESINLPGESYYTWIEASKHCDNTNETLMKQVRKTRSTWAKLFRSPSYPIRSPSDLASRILLFPEKRERLSTLAHLWNDSTLEERFSYFQILLRIIGGESMMSDDNQERLTPEVMSDMPMGNYSDMPRERLAHWCDYFLTLDRESKGEVFRAVWLSQSSEEQHDIIKDLRYLFSEAAQSPVADLVAEEVDEESVVPRVVDLTEEEELRAQQKLPQGRRKQTADTASSSSASAV